MRNSYVRALGLSLNTEGPGRSGVFSAGRSINTATITTEVEEEEMRKLASTPNIYELIACSIAPSIYGSLDIKKAIACLLFGGSRKRYVRAIKRVSAFVICVIWIIILPACRMVCVVVVILTCYFLEIQVLQSLSFSNLWRDVHQLVFIPLVKVAQQLVLLHRLFVTQQL